MFLSRAHKFFAQFSFALLSAGLCSATPAQAGNLLSNIGVHMNAVVKASLGFDITTCHMTRDDGSKIDDPDFGTCIMAAYDDKRANPEFIAQMDINFSRTATTPGAKAENGNFHLEWIPGVSDHEDSILLSDAGQLIDQFASCRLTKTTPVKHDRAAAKYIKSSNDPKFANHGVRNELGHVEISFDDAQSSALFLGSYDTIALLASLHPLGKLIFDFVKDDEDAGNSLAKVELYQQSDPNSWEDPDHKELYMQAKINLFCAGRFRFEVEDAKKDPKK